EALPSAPGHRVDWTLPHERERTACSRGLLYFVQQSGKSGARIHFHALALMSARRESAPGGDRIAYFCGAVGGQRSTGAFDRAGSSSSKPMNAARDQGAGSLSGIT